jgi:hypothetical protein
MPSLLAGGALGARGLSADEREGVGAVARNKPRERVPCSGDEWTNTLRSEDVVPDMGSANLEAGARQQVLPALRAQENL